MRCSVCVLLYGDHLDLARRCLSSLDGVERAGPIADVRLGFNDACAETVDYASRWARERGVPVYGFTPVRFEGDSVRGANVGKYPLMRRMFYPAALPALAELVFWFDDDSFVPPREGWLGEIAGFFDDGETVLAGEPWRAVYRGAQLEGYRSLPWFTGRPESVPGGPSRSFAQGGGWQARTRFLTWWDYPFPELRHNGGDVALGRLVFEQGARFLPHRGRVICNAAPRRGLSEPPAWSEGGSREPWRHHAFSHLEACLNDFGPPARAATPWPGSVLRRRGDGPPRYLCSISEGRWPPSYFAPPGSTWAPTSSPGNDRTSSTIAP